VTRAYVLSLCLISLACVRQAPPAKAPADGRETPAAATMPAAGEYVAISEPRYGQLDSVVGAPGQGERAPDFELPNHLGGTTRLSEALAKGPVVLMFYRGFW